MKRTIPSRIARFMGKGGETKMRLMAEISRRISASTDPAQVLPFIIDAAREIVDFDAAGIFLLDDESKIIRCVAARGYGAEGDDAPVIEFESARGITGWAIDTGESVIVDEVVDDDRYLNLRPETRSQVSVPILGDGRVIGAFSLECDRPRSFSEADAELLSALAFQVAIAIERAAIHRERMERKRLDEELRIAREVQLSLLPGEIPEIPGFDVAGINIPSRDVGGDYYDFVFVSEGHLGVAVADVSGKGIPAALIMASFRAFLRAEIRSNYAIRYIFSKVNRLLYETVKDNQFVSAFYGVLDLARRRFTYSNAGHYPPILFREGAEHRQLDEGGGVVLGVFEEVTYREQFTDLQEGDVLLLYTDGLIEAEDPSGEMFGRERLENFVAARAATLTADELCQALYVEMAEFTNIGHSEDDTTIVVIKILRGDRNAAPRAVKPNRARAD